MVSTFHKIHWIFHDTTIIANHPKLQNIVSSVLRHPSLISEWHLSYVQYTYSVNQLCPSHSPPHYVYMPPPPLHTCFQMTQFLTHLQPFVVQCVLSWVPFAWGGNQQAANEVLQCNGGTQTVNWLDTVIWSTTVPHVQVTIKIHLTDQ